MDLSDEMPSESDEDDNEIESNVEKDADITSGEWKWQTGSAPEPYFSVDPMSPGRPDHMPSNAQDLRPIDFFYKLIPIDFVTFAHEETVKYFKEKQRVGLPTRFWTEREICKDDVLSFVALILASGVLRSRSLSTYWAEKSPAVVKLPSFAHIMERRRFDFIRYCFHLNDNSKQPPANSDSSDSLYKVRPLYNLLQENCRKYWKLGTFVSLDESMVNWKGKSRYKQYIRSKPIRWGFKFFCLCDPETGYFKDFELYTGRKTVQEKYGLCTDIVLMLAHRNALEWSKCVIIADNYYTSPQLISVLASKDIGFVGTCQLTRRHVPANLIKFNERGPNIDRGSTKSAFIILHDVNSALPNVPLFCVSWYDNRASNFLATAGGLAKQAILRRLRNGKQEQVSCPKLVRIYTEKMGGVDLADQNKGRYSCSAILRTRKLWFRIFQGLLDIAVTNSWQLYRCSDTGNHRKNHQEFIFSICDSLLADAASFRARLLLARGEAADDHRIVKQKGTSRCVVCSLSKDKIRTVYMCAKCKRALCPDECFQYFHKNDVKVSPHFKICTSRE